jgi:hypothetical protein
LKKITFLIVILIAFSTLSSQRVGKVEAASRTLRVPQDYTSIQAAINASSDGDIISVASGIYNENPTVRVQNNISLIGQSSSNTVVNGNITINDHYQGVGIRNFDIKGELIYGSYIGYSHYVSNNIIRKGIVFTPHSSSIVDNIVYGNITIEIGGPWRVGGYNTVENNVLYGGGVILQGGPSVPSDTIKNNTCINAPLGVLETDTPLTNYGRNNITENHFIDCGIGVKVIGNELKSNSSITGNTFERCGYGIVLNHVLNESIFHNSFIDNAVQVWINQSNLNSWDNGYPSGGNYWSDYHGMDFYHGPNQNLAGSDGIGDTPYSIGINNTDSYPLMSFSDEFS